MSYLNEIDPIGEGEETVNINKDTFLKDKTESISTNVCKITNQVEYLKQVIDLFGSIPDKDFLVKKLNTFHKNISESSTNILEAISDISEKYDIDNEE